MYPTRTAGTPSTTMTAVIRRGSMPAPSRGWIRPGRSQSTARVGKRGGLLASHRLVHVGQERVELVGVLDVLDDVGPELVVHGGRHEVRRVEHQGLGVGQQRRGALADVIRVVDRVLVGGDRAAELD